MNHLSFNERCYELLKTVPKGKVTTYKILANALSCKAYRAVGNAMKNNPNIPKVPCHRVVNSNGELGGYLYGIDVKIELLEKEGIKIKNGKIVDFEKVLYEFS
jgi:methylated-DNA-[protein]-cysteine S-methyltransferase